VNPRSGGADNPEVEKADIDKYAANGRFDR